MKRPNKVAMCNTGLINCPTSLDMATDIALSQSDYGGNLCPEVGSQVALYLGSIVLVLGGVGSGVSVGNLA